MFGNMNSGYVGYQMSQRAKEAYECGEMPISQWTKSAMLKEIGEIIGTESDVYRALEKTPLRVLRAKLLANFGWYHTSMYVNRTDFYGIDSVYLEKLTVDEVKSWIEDYKREKAEEKKEKEEKKEPEARLGSLCYYDWYGPKTRRRYTDEELNDVWIVEKGCFYFAYSDKECKHLIMKKKTTGNGTRVHYVTEPE